MEKPRKSRFPHLRKKTVAIIVAILLLLLFAVALAWDQFGPKSEEPPPAPSEENQEEPAIEEGVLITKVSAVVTPSSYSSTSCSKTFKFTGKITVSRAGTVKYVWEKSTGAKSAAKSLKFTKAGTKSVPFSWTVNGDYSGWAKLKTTSPESVSSSKASFTETCVFAVTKVTVTISPSTNDSCPETYTVTGKITVNKAGTVKYKWVRSDGTLSSTQTLTFSSVGTKPITDSWTINGDSYAGWEQIQVTSPNSMTSSKATFTFTACPSEPN